ncbi:unnamed protein product [Lymnaea stagnalis]|uniref:G-protein coupled receptors family 3 profile domain-containing protein n=1 Tax=Lymnaea stagnalis TaxID=6523 RepID=A0AAV2ICG4_LYMST
MWALNSILLLLLALTYSVAGQSCSSSFTTTECYFTSAVTSQPSFAEVNKYFVIGGLFDVHEKGSTSDLCSSKVSTQGLLNLLAFFWGVNQFSTLLDTTRVSVGAVAFDNCMRPELSLEHLLSYSRCDIHIQGMEASNLVAYVGPYTNEDALRTGAIASDIGITLISPTANTMELNSANQKTLLRLSPPFSYDLKAIVEFLKNVKSGYVMIVYAGDDAFWKAAFNELTTQMDKSICIQFTADLSKTTMNQLVNDLAVRLKSKYIVPLMSQSSLDELMTNIFNRSDVSSKFVFILNSVIGRDLQFLKSKSYVASNAIIIDQYDDPTSADWSSFSNYIDSVRSNISFAKNIPSTWLASSNLPNLTAISSTMKRSITRTLFSVKNVIKGLDTLMRAGCATGTNYQFCDAYRSQNSKKDSIYPGIKNAFNMFTDLGELSYQNINYTYYQFLNRNDGGQIQPIGSFSFNNQGVLTPTFTENLMDVKYENAYSGPVCPLPYQNLCCEVPTTIAPPTTTPIVATGTTAAVTGSNGKSSVTKVEYPTEQAITGAFSDQSRDSKEYGTRFDLGHKWIIALGVLAGLGILCVIIFEIYILYKLLGTSMGRQWRTMWLGQLLLFGLFLCYLVLFAYLPIPTKATCGITRFGVGVSYAFCFAVLLVKLMVILTSKSSDLILPGELASPNYLKGIYQFLLFIFAVGVQIVIDIQWLITVPPEAIKVTSNNKDHVWICNHYTWEAGSGPFDMKSFVRTNFDNHLMSLIYIMVMILITTILSLNAHGIITNHRESIFIGIAAGFSIPIWLAWGLVGGLNKDHEYSEEFGDACVAFGLLITATLILFSMFLPKVRQLVNMGVEGIYLEDDRETIYGGSVIMAPSSYHGGKGPSSVIFVNNSGIYSEPVMLGNGDPSKPGVATHLKHPGSTVYSLPPTYLKKAESAYGGSTRVLKITDDLRGRYPHKRTQSEIAFGSSGRPRSTKGTLPRSRSQTNLGAL